MQSDWEEREQHKKWSRLVGFNEKTKFFGANFPQKKPLWKIDHWVGKNGLKIMVLAKTGISNPSESEVGQDPQL